MNDKRPLSLPRLFHFFAVSKTVLIRLSEMGHWQNTRNFVRSAALLLLFAGCSASGPSFPDSSFATQPVASDKARIVFYRDSDMNFRAATIGIDGSIIGTVSHGGFAVAEIAPGDHKLSAWVRGFFQEFVIGMSVEAGKTYYMRVSQRAERLVYPLIPLLGAFAMLADTKGEFQLELMAESTALQQLRELKLSE